MTLFSATLFVVFAFFAIHATKSLLGREDARIVPLGKDVCTMMAVASFLVISFAQFLPKSVGRPVSSRMPSFLRVLMFFWAFSFEMLPC